MDILQKIGDKAKEIGTKARDVGDAAKNIAKKSTDILEVTKIKYDISKLEKEMENNLMAIGQLQYRHFRGEEGLEEEISRLLDATGEIDTHISSLQDEIRRLQPKPPYCEACKINLPDGANFCHICGNKAS